MTERKKLTLGKRIALSVTAGVAALLVLATGALAVLNRPLSQTEIDEAIEARLSAAVADSDSVSSALFTVYSGATGEVRDYAVGASAGSQYHAASVGKTMLAAAFGQLVDEGVLSFDDPVATWLDAETLDGLFVVDGVDYSAEVTVGQLLSHTSGIGDYFEGPVTSGKTMLELITADPDHLFAPHDLVAFTRDNQTPVGRPGQKFVYSDTGYILLGLALEKIEGASYAQILETRFFTPLSMTSSYLMTEFGTASDILPITVNGIDFSTRNALSVDWAGGGVVTTTGDLLTFMRALEGGELVSEAVHAKLTNFAQKYDKGIYYGAGMMKFTFKELSPLLFTMTDVRGAIGSTGTFAMYDPSTGNFYIANFGSLEYTEKAIGELVEIRLILDRLAK